MLAEAVGPAPQHSETDPWGMRATVHLERKQDVIHRNVDGFVHFVVADITETFHDRLRHVAQSRSARLAA